MTVKPQNLAIIILSMMMGIHISYCPGLTDFKFVVPLNEFANAHCTVTGGTHIKVCAIHQGQQWEG
jgi:hypothetical protein